MSIEIKQSAYTSKQLSDLYEQAENKINRRAETWCGIINYLIEAVVLFIGLELGSYIMRTYEEGSDRTAYTAVVAFITALVLFTYVLEGKYLLIKLFNKKYIIENRYDVSAFHKYKQYLKTIEQMQEQISTTDYVKVTLYNNELLLTTGSANVSCTFPYDFGTYTKRVITDNGLDFSVMDNDIQSMLETIEKGGQA